VTLQLAKLLADVADDRPAAIAHARVIEPFTRHGFEARFLEARWRAELGDLAGASVALARLADAVQAAIGVLVPGPGASGGEAEPLRSLWLATDGDDEPPPYGSREDARVAIATWLEEGARIHEIDRGEVGAARRLIELAIQLAPRRRSLQDSHRRLLAAFDLERSGKRAAVPPPAPRAESSKPISVARSPFTETPSAVPPARGSAPEAPALPKQPPLPGARGWSTDRDGGSILAPPETTQVPWAPDAFDPAYTQADDDSVDDEIRAEELAERLRGNPADDACAEELIEVLDRLGRDHDMLALLSARIDEDVGDRAALVGRRRELLERMVRDAEVAGRQDEAALYRLMLERTD
jgi:hypothetical protein